MKLYIYNHGQHDQEFLYKKVSDENLENAIAYCLGINLGYRHYYLAKRASKKPAHLSENFRVVELDEKVAHILLCYEAWQKRECNTNIQGWEYLFPYKLQKMIVDSKDVGIPSIKNLDEFNRRVLKIMRYSIHLKERLDSFMEEDNTEES